jgi:hypothetical protein
MKSVRVGYDYISTITQTFPKRFPLIVSSFVSNNQKPAELFSSKVSKSEMEIGFYHAPILWLRHTVVNLLAITLFYLGSGCARFHTNQTSTDTDAAGHVIRTVTTTASATTFFDSQSKLAAFKAMQTDKSQTASVGSLEQASSSTNANTLIVDVVSAAIKAAK